MGTVLGYFVGFVKHFTMKTGDPLKTVLLNMGIILRLNLGGATGFETHRCIKKNRLVRVMMYHPVIKHGKFQNPFEMEVHMGKSSLCLITAYRRTAFI